MRSLDIAEAIVRIRRILDHGRWPTGLEVTDRERMHLRATLERLELERDRRREPAHIVEDV